MPFPMKIQPIDFNTPEESAHYEPVKPVAKSRFKRLFERQFSSVLRISASDKSSNVEEPHHNRNGSEEFEPSSACLAKMVQNYMEESGEKSSATLKCGRSKCNCFNGNNTDSSEDESNPFNCFGDSNHTSSGDACEILKSLVPCATRPERNLLADTAKIVDKNKISKRKDDFCRKIVIEGLVALGYDASICKSRWEKSPSYPAGEYEYVDVIVEGERLIIDIDFRSEFEIARPTKTYKAILQTLPHLFVGKAERLQTIIHIVSDAAKQSLKKKGMHFPPWRKADYVKAKWLSPYTRSAQTPTIAPTSLNSAINNSNETDSKSEKKPPLICEKSSCGEFELVFGERSSSAETNHGDVVFAMSDTSDEEKILPVKQSKPSETLKPKDSQSGIKIVASLALVAEDKP